MAIALAALSVPALAINPVIPATDATESATVATLAPLEAVAPVDLASPDNAPLAAQIALLAEGGCSHLSATPTLWPGPI